MFGYLPDDYCYLSDIDFRCGDINVTRYKNDGELLK